MVEPANILGEVLAQAGVPNQNEEDFVLVEGQENVNHGGNANIVNPDGNVPPGEAHGGPVAQGMPNIQPGNGAIQGGANGNENHDQPLVNNNQPAQPVNNNIPQVGLNHQNGPLQGAGIGAGNQNVLPVPGAAQQQNVNQPAQGMQVNPNGGVHVEFIPNQDTIAMYMFPNPTGQILDNYYNFPAKGFNFPVDFGLVSWALENELDVLFLYYFTRFIGNSLKYVKGWARRNGASHNKEVDPTKLDEAFVMIETNVDMFNEHQIIGFEIQGTRDTLIGLAVPAFSTLFDAPEIEINTTRKMASQVFDDTGANRKGITNHMR